ncbi:hypothetical protein [Devosia submarina]|uniref:hypothetical protein n=1 Tax=Devosia submarina TaxID=1173082 RepID=UPI000D3D7A71|nr:hypothetical protein [Devosia submarina]
MQMNRRLTNGLAWAGAFLVVGVPAADLLSAQLLGDRTAPPAAQVAVIEPQTVAPVPAPQNQRPAAKPVEVAAVEPKAPAAAAPAEPAASEDVVDKFVQSGKPLPSYITGAPAQAAAPKPAPAAAPKPAQTAAVQPAPVSAPKPEQPAPVSPPQNAAAPAAPAPIGPQPAPAAPPADPVQTASIPAKTAPVPMPLSMRPKPVAVAAANPVVNQPAFVVNEPVFVPPTVERVPSREITAEDLEDWETGPLADFLARREAPRQAEAPVFAEDEEFFVEREPRFPRRDRLVGPELFFYGQ